MAANGDGSDRVVSNDEEKEIERELADISFEELGKANKNRPSEPSSEVPVGRFREVIPSPKKVVRDPRFESLCGNLDQEGFGKRENFSYEVEPSAEKEKTQKLIKKSKDAAVVGELKNHVWIVAVEFVVITGLSMGILAVGVHHINGLSWIDSIFYSVMCGALSCLDFLFKTRLRMFFCSIGLFVALCFPPRPIAYLAAAVAVVMKARRLSQRRLKAKTMSTEFIEEWVEALANSLKKRNIGDDEIQDITLDVRRKLTESYS